MEGQLKIRNWGREIIGRFGVMLSVVFTISFGPTASGQFHLDVFPNLTGDELLDAIVSDYKPLSVLNYSQARDIMYGNIYKVEDSVACVYSGHKLFLPPDVDPSTFLYMNGSLLGINAEHSYPRSKGADVGNAFSDMHHLFPTRSAINASRSNFPYGEIEDDETDVWFYMADERTSIPTSNKNLYSERIDGVFEPKEAHKGNVARAMFYFYTMYEDQALDEDPDFFEIQRETLCIWHSADPVDSLEFGRTFDIASYQSNRPNPFVMDQTLAERTYCDGVVNVTNLNRDKFTVYPNPAARFVEVEAVGEANLNVFNRNGELLFEIDFWDRTTVDLSVLQAGIYFFEVDGHVESVVVNR